MPTRKPKKSLQDKVFGAIAKPIRKAGAAAGRASVRSKGTNDTLRAVGKAVKTARTKTGGRSRPVRKRSR